MRYQDQLHKKHELEMRARISRDLHDDVGATLSSIKAYSEIIESTPDRKTISGLIKENAAEMIERLEVIAWATNPDHDRFKSLADTMVKFAVPVMYTRSINLRFEKNGISDDIIVPGDIRQNIFLIFKEAINNIVKHASATKCNVSLYIQDNTFHMELADNGIGCDLSAKSNRSGLNNMKRRAGDLQGEIHVLGKTAEGTIVKLLVPYPFQIHNS
jgi:signal transduction histidine kinase